MLYMLWSALSLLFIELSLIYSDVMVTLIALLMEGGAVNLSSYFLDMLSLEAYSLRISAPFILLLWSL